jgi:beta-N-acetylhexosaminidase
MSLRELRRHAGRLAIVGFDGASVPDDLRRLAAEFDLGGVIYFARNIVEPRQVAELSREVAGLARDWPLWVSVDQEGGRVARLRSPFTEWPPAITLGRSADARLAERFASALAAELRAVGINLDYAPVLDVHTNPANPVIGDRALADRAELVATLAAAIIRTLQAGGVAACGKHFPGHGDTSVDSHEVLPVVEHERRRLDAVEFVPFRHAVAARVAAIMTAHVLVPALDDSRIASLSPAVIGGLLKGELGFDGVVVSDDLGMKAVSATMPLADAAVGAIAAGCDAVLLCNSGPRDQVEAIEALIRAAESGALPATRIDDAFARQRRVKERFAESFRRPPATALDLVGCARHQDVAREMASWR